MLYYYLGIIQNSLKKYVLYQGVVFLTDFLIVKGLYMFWEENTGYTVLFPLLLFQIITLYQYIILHMIYKKELFSKDQFFLDKFSIKCPREIYHIKGVQLSIFEGINVAVQFIMWIALGWNKEVAFLLLSLNAISFFIKCFIFAENWYRIYQKNKSSGLKTILEGGIILALAWFWSGLDTRILIIVCLLMFGYMILNIWYIEKGGFNKNMVHIKNLTFRYHTEDEYIFKNANVELESGLWILKGENGEGKTTFLHMIVEGKEGMKDSGEFSETTEITVNNNVILLDEETEIPLSMTEKQLYKLIMKLNDLQADEAYPTIYKDKKLAMYSLGEKKYAVLRILSKLKPNIVLMDEYLTNLDETHLTWVMGMLEDMKKKGVLVIVSSHDQHLQSMFSSVIRIENKEILIREN